MNKVFKALSDPTRRRVLQLLRVRPKSAGELSDHFAVSKPTMSAHFAVLQEAGLIDSEKSGRTVIYRLVMSVLEEALLGFAQTFGWGLATGRATARQARHGPPAGHQVSAGRGFSDGSRIFSVPRSSTHCTEKFLCGFSVVV